MGSKDQWSRGAKYSYSASTLLVEHARLHKSVKKAKTFLQDTSAPDPATSGGVMTTSVGVKTTSPSIGVKTTS